MLVSAAMDPYRKSCGCARRTAATAGGRSAALRSTASPSRMWVPGVHAHATVGMSATNASAPSASRQRRATGLLAGLARIVVGRVTDTVVGAGFAAIVEV